jgi:hypothetical protein
VENQRKCQLTVCDCRAPAGDPYCSEYCQQAASQAIARDFCQCTHAGCQQPASQSNTENGRELPASISDAPGWLTIEYASADDLRRQLQRLAQALDQQPAAGPDPAEVVPRRSPAAERDRLGQKAQSA